MREQQSAETADCCTSCGHLLASHTPGCSACDCPRPFTAESAESRVRDALLAELADEHGCDVEDEATGRLLACEPCAERAVRLAARLAHERLTGCVSGQCLLTITTVEANLSDLYIEDDNPSESPTPPEQADQ